MRLGVVVTVALVMAGCCCLDRSAYDEPSARTGSLPIESWSSLAAAVPGSGLSRDREERKRSERRSP